MQGGEAVRIKKGIQEAIAAGKLSINMDSYILELPNGGTVSFVDRGGEAVNAVATQPDENMAAFGSDLHAAISFAKASP